VGSELESNNWGKGKSAYRQTERRKTARRVNHTKKRDGTLGKASKRKVRLEQERVLL